MVKPVVHIGIDCPLKCDVVQFETELRGIAGKLGLELTWADTGKSHDAAILYCDRYPEAPRAIGRYVVLVIDTLQGGHCPEWADHMISGRGVKGLKWALRFLAALLECAAVRLSYGAAPDTHMWFTPASQAIRRPARAEMPVTPLALLVHGGFWRHEVACDHMAPLAAHLSKQGWAVLNLEYRRGGNWRESVDDITSILMRLPSIADELRFDTQRIVAIGHSSGAHLLHLALARSGRMCSPRLFLSLAGVLDLYSARETARCHEAIMAAETRSASHLPDPGQLKIASRIIAVHGCNDTTVSPDQPARFKARYAGECDTLLVSDCDHMDLIKPTGSHWAGLVNRMHVAVMQAQEHRPI